MLEQLGDEVLGALRHRSGELQVHLQVREKGFVCVTLTRSSLTTHSIKRFLQPPEEALLTMDGCWGKEVIFVREYRYRELLGLVQAAVAGLGAIKRKRT